MWSTNNNSKQTSSKQKQKQIAKYDIEKGKILQILQS